MKIINIRNIGRKKKQKKKYKRKRKNEWGKNKNHSLAAIPKLCNSMAIVEKWFVAAHAFMADCIQPSECNFYTCEYLRT